ncbi:MAG TPA: adenylate/guanylate cyclase domain-containing protein [Acidimicrobiales bacterium]
MGPDRQRAKVAGQQAVTGLGGVVKSRVASLLQRDPERLQHALELGLVSHDWLNDPAAQPISNATPLEMVERYLERSVEQRPSMLAALGLSTIQIMSAHDDDDESGSGDNERLTIAFTDLEGFTRFTAEHGDEAATDLLAEHRRQVGPIIRSRGGRIQKRLGDGLFLTFLQPEAAVLACLELVEHPPAPLRLRAGIHVGEVILLPDDVLGHTVNVAARITEQAKGGQVLVSTDVRAATKDLPGAAFGRARRRTAKGLTEPLHVCPVTSA